MAGVPEDFVGMFKKVAFFATVDKTRMGKVGANEILVFEKVITNEGSAYNSHHGLFTAPIDGLYLFTATIMADNGAEVWARFALNNKPVTQIYARGTDDRHDQGSQTIILKLSKGDIVCIQSEHETRIYGDTYTTFAGYLIS